MSDTLLDGLPDIKLSNYEGFSNDLNDKMVTIEI